MKFIIDTSILADLEKGETAVSKRLLAVTGNLDLSAYNITFVNLFEFLFGIKLRSPKNQQIALEFIDKFWVLHTSNETSKILANLRFKYDKKGIVLSLADFIIAALAIENDLTLVTRDTDFEKITELKRIII